MICNGLADTCLTRLIHIQKSSQSADMNEALRYTKVKSLMRGGGLGSRPKNMYGETLGDGVEYHLMKPTPRR